MTWTDKPPKEPGWYWYKSEWTSPSGEKYPFKVIRFYCEDNMKEAIKSSDRWAGPIPEPTEE
jgi:hypothetical protein